MNKVNFEVVAGQQAPLKLSKAILIYRGDAETTFATVHDVAIQGKTPIILEGKSMTAEAAVCLATELSSNAIRGGFVPANLLFLDGDVMAWWLPPARRHIAFRAAGLGADERGEVVPHPGLVFKVDGMRRWCVWAVLGGERPSEGTALYQAPYFNVSSDGAICAGNVSLPDGSTAERIGAWNDAFFGSFFTHPNVHGKLVTYRGGAFKFWRDMLDGRHGEFPEHALVPAKRTLSSVLARRQEAAP